MVPGGCRSVLTFTFMGQLDVVVGFMLCGCASVFTYLFFPELLVFIYSLTTLSVTQDCMTSNDAMINEDELERCRRKRSSILRHYSDIHLKELWKITKNFTQVSRCPGRVSNLSPPEYMTEALPLEPICSVFLVLKDLFHDMRISRLSPLRVFTLKPCKVTSWYSG
jgi:hypothetical protein